jgi:hypothetical protein
MPTVLRVKGYRFFFFSNEGDEPRHIHVERGKGYAKFWLDTVLLARSKGFHTHELAEIDDIIEENQEAFTEAWDEHFGS